MIESQKLSLITMMFNLFTRFFFRVDYTGIKLKRVLQVQPHVIGYLSNLRQ